jgi:hypothetical protein
VLPLKSNPLVTWYRKSTIYITLESDGYRIQNTVNVACNCASVMLMPWNHLPYSSNSSHGKIKSHSVLDLGSNDGVGCQWCHYWPEIAALTKQSGQRHCHWEANLCLQILGNSLYLWNGSVMHNCMHVTIIYQHALHIGTNLSGLVQAWRWWTLPLRRLLLNFHRHSY